MLKVYFLTKKKKNTINSPFLKKKIYFWLSKLKNKQRVLGSARFTTKKLVRNWNIFLIKKNTEFTFVMPAIYYLLNSYKLPLNFIIYKYLYIYYLYTYNLLENTSNKSLLKLFKTTFFKVKLKYLFTFFYSYTQILHANHFYLVFYSQHQNISKLYKNIYFLTFAFRKNRFFVSLTNYKRVLHLFLSPGLFLKVSGKGKSFKKNKLIKLLMVKCLRKILILTLIKDLILIIRSLPTYLLDLIRFLNAPILRPFNNPTSGKDDSFIQETDVKKKILNYIYVIFLESQSYVKFKVKKKGRVKRKIRRKLIMLNKLVD